MFRILNGESKTITGAALIVGAASLFSRCIGLLRDRILAGEFGAGERLDIYFAAFRIPDFLYQLLIIGALSAGFIPIFSRLRQHDRRHAWEFAGLVLRVILLGLSILSFLISVLAPMIVPLMTPGFSVSAQAETITLTRIMLLSPIFLGISALFGGILQAHKQFFINAVAPILYNIGIILGALYFVPRFGLSGLAWGVVLGAILHACIQLPSVARLGLGVGLRSWRDPELRTLGLLMAPRTVALAVSQVTLVAMTIIASTLDRGSLAMFTFANNMASLPIGLFGVTYAIAAFPTFAENIAEHNLDRFRRSFAATVRHVLFFILPSTILFVLLRAQIVRTVLGAGAFDWTDTVRTMDTLAALAIGMFAVSLNYVLIRGFWAHEDTWTPAWIAVLGSAVSIISGWWAAQIYGVVALGLAVSFGAIAQLVVSWILLRRHAETLGETSILISLLKISLGALFLAFGVQATKIYFGHELGTETFITIALQGGAAAAAGLLVYFVVCLLLRSKELLHFMASIRRRIAPNPEQLELFEQ